jgi:hypothetical protein
MEPNCYFVDEFDQTHVIKAAWFDDYLKKMGLFQEEMSRQLKAAIAPLAEERRETMQKADMSKTDEGVTTLESGQTITHHRKGECISTACTLHNPMPGPWDDWPRFYRADSRGIYRLCPHNIGHPAIEQVVYWLSNGQEDLVPHRCCDQCPCMPKGAVPEGYFQGPRIGVPLSLYDWAGTPRIPTLEEVDEAALVPIPMVENPVLRQGTPPNPDDPNVWTGSYLDMNRVNFDAKFYDLLRRDMMKTHHINEVMSSGGGDYDVVCNAECRVDLHNYNGEWKNLNSGWCPNVEIALAAGWKPAEWSIEDSDDEEEDDD